MVKGTPSRPRDSTPTHHFHQRPPQPSTALSSIVTICNNRLRNSSNMICSLPDTMDMHTGLSLMDMYTSLSLTDMLTKTTLETRQKWTRKNHLQTLMVTSTTTDSNTTRIAT